MIRHHQGRKSTTPRLAVTGFAAAVLLLGISACMGLWNTPLQLAKLLVSDVVVTGASGYVLVSVADMPSGGAASIEFGVVGDPAITIVNIDETSIAVEGLSGFTELAWQFTATGGTLIAANGSTGVVGGQILKITFAVTGPNPTFAVDTTKVKIGSDINTWITAWDLATDIDYYTK